jgi:DNA mismatch repair ATPase MutS
MLALVTGSNMSGKSSFLRTVGVNVLLARAGAPACARRLDLVACEPVTSVQVTDAPAEGMSRFYAEVKRIRGILDAVDAAERDVSRPPCLYLVDEMLSGTNSRERHQASHAIVERLVASRRSAGLVTTHDLELVSVEHQNPVSVHTFHFSDRFDGQALHFDYRLREGVATTTNALHVLRMEGIDVPATGGA